MYIPSAREVVQIAGRPGVFLVLYVDQEAMRVDVMALGDNAYVAENIPILLLRPHRIDESQADP